MSRPLATAVGATAAQGLNRVKDVTTNSRYTISQLARAAAVPPSTVRYYERAGLLAPQGRTGANYRVYDDQSLARLRFIRAAQRLGFQLDDVRHLLTLQSGGNSACPDVQAILTARIAEIDSRLRDLQHVREVLGKALQQCRESESRGRCHVMCALKGQA